MADNTGYAPLGKAGMLPRSKWVIGTIYHKLDIVTHNENTYMALVDNAQEPKDDGENWMLLLEGVPIATVDTLGKVKPDGETILADEDGTLHSASQVPEGVTFVDLEAEDETLPTKIPVNADQLGGQNPEYYATEESVSKIISGETAVGKATDADTVDGYHASDLLRLTNRTNATITKDETIDELVAKIDQYGEYRDVIYPSQWANFTFPDDVVGTRYYVMSIMRPHLETYYYIATLYDLYTGHQYVNTKYFGSTIWTGWKKQPLSADLANYLPLTGGTLTGILKISVAGWNGIDAINSSVNERARVEIPTNGGCARLIHFTDDSNLNGLQVNASTTDLSKLIQIYLRKSGVTTNYNILHTGNSSPIIQSTSAPTDTTALWYNTTTKTLKSYTDGAWT